MRRLQETARNAKQKIPFQKMKININTDAIATDSLIEASTQRRIPSNFEFVKGDQVQVEVTLYNKDGNMPSFISGADSRLMVSVGKIETRELFTQAQQRTYETGTFSFILDLARTEVVEASGNLAIEITFESALQSEILLQAPIRLRESYISSPLLPSYPTDLNVVAI